MRRSLAIVAGVVVGVIATFAIFATVAHSTPEAQPYGAPIGPVMTPDTGAGEQLILVVGGVYSTRDEAFTANTDLSFGDLQGYYVVPVAQFQGFREQVGTPGDFALVSAFRTQAGADEFVELATSFGVPATIYPQRVLSLGGLYAGLGQEAAPDGAGPLLGPTADSLP
jgi:hypothetical protein